MKGLRGLDLHCWVHEAVEVRSSAIDGHGLFATEPLATGTVVARYGGRLVSRAQLLKMFEAAADDPDSDYIDCISIEDGVDLLMPSGQSIHYGNHSCDPNLWHLDAFTIAARRDIPANEELTIDYATQTDNPEFFMDCLCGTAMCRGRFTGADWRLPELQDLYGDHWVPVLLTRIYGAKHGKVLLETERLVLRRFTPDDADNLVELDGDPEVMRFLSGGPATPRDLIEREILPRFVRYDQRFPAFGSWAVIEKATGDFLGWIVFRPHDETNPSDVSLGFRFRKSAWGQGYATECSRELITLGFNQFGVLRVSARTYEDNIASRRVMEKLGMTLVRRFRVTIEELRESANFHVTSEELWDGDDVEYALTKADWEAEAWLGAE